jgi:hypothetical protein
MSRDEHYILQLCDDLLKATASRQHRFDFLRGDPNKKDRCVRLPVDAYYEENRLVIEYRECQHSESIAIMDQRMTVSGITRGEQRRRYDQRRREVLPANNITVVELDYSMFKHGRNKRLSRDPVADSEVIRTALCSRGISI